MSTSPPRVLYCSRHFPRSRAVLREQLAGTDIQLVEVDDARPLEAQATGMDAIIPASGRITAAVMDAALPRLRVICQFGAGLDGVDLAAAAARGIPVRNVPGANAQAVAEHALFLMLALAKRRPLHAASFEKRLTGDPAGIELAGRTLGIVGLGASGRALARIAGGLGMEVIAVRLHHTGLADSDARWVGGPEDLQTILSRADVVSLHVPSSPATRGMIDARSLTWMKPTAFLINVGRGDLVDRDALVAALRSRRIAGAGLDVYWQEPPDPNDPIFTFDNVVASPHVGGASEEALQRIGEVVAGILRQHLLDRVG